MNSSTLEALKGSIKKWEQIRDGELEDEGRDNCPLCGVFYHIGQDYEDNCIGCPVYAATNFRYCSHTPYSNYANARREQMPQLDEEEWAELSYKLSQAEIDFLTSLLPESSDE